MLWLATEEGVYLLDEGGRAMRLGPNQTRIRGVASHPQDPPRLLAASDTAGVYVRRDAQWDLAVRGVAHSVAWSPDGRRAYAGLRGPRAFASDDGGVSWHEDLQVRAVAAGPGVPPPHVAGHPLDVLTIVIPQDARIYLGVEAAGVLRWARGSGWHPASTGLHPDVHAMAYDPQSSDTLYAATGAGIYRSLDGGSSWAPAMAGIDRRYASAVAVLPGLQTVLAAASPDPPPRWNRPAGARAALFRSVNSGLTWERVAGGLPAEFVEEVSAIVADAAAPGRVYVTVLDGQVWRSDDAGSTWRRIATDLPAIWHAAASAGS
ncbi:MAG: WD40/YVTN/BNR-like repeat-containing protein [bacterium]